MLLWNDGFSAYPNLAALSGVYTVTGSPLVAQEGRITISGRQIDRSIRLLNTQSIKTAVLQDAVLDPGADVLIFGMALNIASSIIPASNLPCITIRRDAVTQTNIYCRFSSFGYFFEVVRMNSVSATPDKLLGTSPLYPFGKWQFLEFRIFYSNTGNVRWLSNGIESFFNPAVRTEASPSVTRKWNTIEIRGAGNLFKITDLYVNNGNFGNFPRLAGFLGNTQSRRVRPTLKKKGTFQQWVTHHNNGTLIGNNEVDMHVLSGQSNAQGTFNSPTPPSGSIVNPNPALHIWDRRNLPVGFKALQAGFNNNNQLFLGPIGAHYGPEMSLADSLHDYHNAEALGLFTPFGHCMVKGAQDSASLFPSAPDFCFNPLFPGNLYNDLNGIANPARGCLKNDMLAAIAAIGGSSRIRKIHFYWHQGEADAILDFSTNAYRANLELFLNTVVADFAPIPVQFHIVRIHKNLKMASGPNVVDGFWWRDSVRSIQELVVRLRTDCRLVNIDDIPLGPDQIHFANNGTEAEGKLLFNSWLDSQNLADEVDEVGLNDGNRTFVEVVTPSRTVTFKSTSPLTAKGCEILASRTAVVGKSSDNPDPAAITLTGLFADSKSVDFDNTFKEYAAVEALDVNNPVFGGFTPETIEESERGFRSK